MICDISRWFLKVEEFIARDMGNRGISSLYVRGDLEKAVRALLSVNSILITSGFVIKKDGSVFPETDGPIGVAVFVRALVRLGKKVSVVTDEVNVDVIKGAVESLGVSVPVEVYKGAFNAGYGLIMSIERPGRAMDGRYYSMRKEDITEWVAPVDELFLSQNVLSVGIGDGGNEIGMGKIHDQLVACGMDGRFISIVPTTYLIVSGVSNWGVYGIVAGLQRITGKKLLHTTNEERLLLESIVGLGAIDGVKKECVMSVDGMSLDVHQQVVEELWAMLSDS